MKEKIGKLRQSARESMAMGFRWAWAHKLRIAVLAIVFALIAPRPVLFQTGDNDPGSPVDGIHAIESAVRPVYGLYGRQGDFQSIVYAGLGHVYTPEMWARTLAWMDSHLRPAADRH